MSQPATRIGDMHTCPQVDSGPKPHVGGPILGGCPTVLIGGMPPARVGDQAACIGPPDDIATGEPTVLIGGKPAARLGNTTVHGGIIVTGCATVPIGTEPIDPTVWEARRHIGSSAWDFEANRPPYPTETHKCNSLSMTMLDNSGKPVPMMERNILNQ